MKVFLSGVAESFLAIGVTQPKLKELWLNKMKIAQLFPLAMILLSLCAATAYSFDGDWRRTIYWISGAVITASVTF